MEMEFHKGRNQGPWFEGWYHKFRTIQGPSLAVIPAVHISGAGSKSASVQVISEKQSWWLEYPASDFSAGKNWVRIGESMFCERGVELKIRRREMELTGSLSFGPLGKLKRDIMGPFRWAPGMECVHSIFSMGHSLTGNLRLDGQMLNFSGGTGYWEGDRGRSFPKRYLWTQCCWGEGSLVVCAATIPMGAFCFSGCLCAVFLQGQEIRLATYRGARLETWSARGAVLRQGDYRLEVTCLGGTSQPLRAPAEGNMDRIIRESLQSRVRCRLWNGEKILLDVTDENAGFEYADSQTGKGPPANCRRT